MDTNSQPKIRRVRRVGSEWHVTRTGLPMLKVPCVNTGSYRPQVSYGFNDDGALVARPVKP